MGKKRPFSHKCRYSTMKKKRLQKEGRPRIYKREAKERVITLLMRGMPITDIAGIKGNPSTSVIYRWMEDPDFMERVIKSGAGAYCGDNRYLKKSEGKHYQMRVMIDRGKKLVGKRMTMSLGTRDLEKARAARDAILKLFDKQGVKLCQFNKAKK